MFESIRLNRHASWVTVVSGVLLRTQPAGAQTTERAPRETAELTYERRPGAEACPSEIELKQKVASHLGYDPFVESAPLTTRVVIIRQAGEFRADMALLEKPNKSLGRRTLRSRSEDCSELSAALALALSIAIDPESAGSNSAAEAPQPKPSEAPTPTTPPPTARPVEAPPPTKAPPPDEPGPRVVPRIGAGTHVSFGTAPATSVGLWISGGAEIGIFAVSLEGRGDLPASRAADPSGSVKSSLLLVSVLPCLQQRFWYVCAVGSVGALQGEGEGLAETSKQTTFYSSAGGRTGLELALGSQISATGFVGAAATLTRTTLRLRGTDVWTTPTLTAIGGVGLIVRFGDGKRAVGSIE